MAILVLTFSMSYMRKLVGGTVFLAAFLLFVVEPMAAKELLPVLGGSSAVWITCLVFFQAALVVGYGYAHWMSRSRRVWVHFAVLVAAVGVVALVFVVPAVLFGILGMPHRPAGLYGYEHPVRTIFLGLGLTIGLPFVVLSATSPLLQAWLARMESGEVPWRLFALSNLGSLLALAAYPTLIEPHLTLAQQWGAWAFGFGVYAVVCGWLAIRVKAASSDPSLREGLGAEPEADSFAALRNDNNVWRRWMWFLLPMGAAMQLSAVTGHLSQDVAAIPMLWVLPLGVYLITFILAFDAPRLYRRWVVMRLLVVMLASLGYALTKVDTALPIGLAILFYLAEVFVACWFCHAEMYRLRPIGSTRSTVFYLLVAAGGAAGTFVVAILCPMIFRANYDLDLAFLAIALLAVAVTWGDGWGPRLLWITGSALLVVLGVMLYHGFGRHEVMRARNFYGSLRVTEDEIDTGGEAVPKGSDGVGSGPVRTLMNGHIRHGSQMLAAARRRTPTTYYAPDSGIGIAMHDCCSGRTKSVGVIGLGAGTLAAYGERGDRIRFYEINPLVEPIARNLFTYISDSPADIRVVGGDGRASLAREAAQGFDVLVVDAFSGDAIPLHLLTREAMEVYKRQLAPGGVIAFHVSNSYLDLAPEILLLARSAGMNARRVESLAVPAEGEYRASWVLVSADAEFFERPMVEALSTRIRPMPGLRLWTDDYSSLLTVMRLR